MNQLPTILMVDDSEDNLLLVRAAFEMAKCYHPLQEAHNGEEAIAYLQGEGRYGDRIKFPLPTVILLDLNMPKKNGFDVLAWVRAQPGLKRLAIVILTASERSEDVERAFDLGATSFLVKPVGLETLAAMLRCLCDWMQFTHFPRLNDETTATGNQPSDLSSHCLAITEHAPWPMATVAGASHLVRAVNPAFCRLMDRRMDQIVGRPFYELLPPKDEAGRVLDRVFQTGNSETYTEEEYPGRPPVFWSYAMWPVWENKRLVAVMIQVTETAQFREKSLALNEALLVGSVRQHELTEAAERSNAQLEVEVTERQKTARDLAEKARLLDLSNDAIIVRDVEGRILYWNHGAEELYGWPREEALGKVSHVLLQSEFPTPIEQMTEELHRNDRWTGELVHTTHAGRRITVLARKALDRDAQGNPAAVLQTITDITERKRAEQEFVAAKDEISRHAHLLEETVAERTGQLRETIRELEGFSYSVSHDMRAPLRAMQSYGQFLVDEYGSKFDEKGINYLQQIMRSAVRLDRLIQDVLSYTRILHSSLPMETVDLDRLVRDIIETYPNGQPIKPQIAIQGTLPKVVGNEALLTQCVSNLLDNGAKFVSPGSTPRLEISAEAREEFLVRVWFKDNGIGIAPENHERIFGLLERIHPGTDYEGNGIGLTIVRKAIERMGAQVGFESELGQGSQFWIQLKKG